MLLMFPDLQVLNIFSTPVYFFLWSSIFLTLSKSSFNFLKKDTVSVSGSKLLKETREISTVSSVYKTSLNKETTTKNNMHRENKTC